MRDYGAPVSWLVLAAGTAVFSADGRDVGSVRHVLGDVDEDLFEGLLIDLAAHGHRYVDAEEISGLHERGVVLRREAAGCEALPEPRPAPGVLRASGDAPPPGGLERRLHRAWELLSGEG
jgi:hypothetical protein